MTRFTHPQWKKMTLFLFWVPEIPCSGELVYSIAMQSCWLYCIFIQYVCTGIELELNRIIII